MQGGLQLREVGSESGAGGSSRCPISPKSRDRVYRDYSGDGSTVFTISESGGTSVDLDPMTGEFWVAFSSSLRQYSATGTLLTNVSLNGGTAVGIDGLGGAWVATSATLYGYDAAGTQRLSLTPFGASTIASVATDPYDGSVWVAYATTGKHYSVSAVLTETLSTTTNGNIVAMGMAIDIDPTLGVFDAADTNGVVIAAGATDWEIDDIWSGSGAEAAGLALGDKIVSINGVVPPSLSASAAQIEAFVAAVRAARSGDDDFEVTRGGSTSTYAVGFEAYWPAYRAAVQGAVSQAASVRRRPKKCPECIVVLISMGAGDIAEKHDCARFVGGTGCEFSGNPPVCNSKNKACF